MKKTQLLLIGLLFVKALSAQFSMQTKAESSDFTATSTHQEVEAFIQDLQKASPYIGVETIAQTQEGRDIPLMIIGNPLPASPSDLIDDDRLVVYIQANIHSGEVEGKEAALMYARDILKQENAEVLKKTVLLICPDLNADGNDRISKLNRTNQNGPSNGVGIRQNAQNLDLNRDAMKAETNEVQAVISNILNRWDPSVIMDCHTTNGSFHEEPITFTWMMNPNGDRNLINYMRDEMMPDVSHKLRTKYEVDNCFYGEFIDRENIDKGWISYAAEPRYLVNYIGVRNRLSILNENYVYADYKTRVWGCYYLIHALMDYCSDNQSEVNALIAQADKATISRGLAPQATDSFAIRYKGQATPEKITIKAFEADAYTDDQGRRRYTKSDRQRTVTVPYIADYFPTESVAFPYAYILDKPDVDVIELLKVHGIKMEQLDRDEDLDVLRFKIAELKPEARLYQGHYRNHIEGEYVKESKTFKQGTYVVRTAQKLGNLVAYLFEPQSDDGLLKWNYFDRYLVPQWGSYYYPYPVYKLIEKTDMASSSVKD